MEHGITNRAIDSSRVLETSITGLLVTLRGFLTKYYLGAQDGRKVAQEQLMRLFNWYGSTPYGDDPNDQYWIRAGIDYAKRTGF